MKLFDTYFSKRSDGAKFTFWSIETANTADEAIEQANNKMRKETEDINQWRAYPRDTARYGTPRTSFEFISPGA